MAATTKTIDPLSLKSLLVETAVNGRPLGTATAFVVQPDSDSYLITNWHVIAGGAADTGELLSPTGAVPDELRVLHHSGQLGQWHPHAMPLFSGGVRAWWEHSRGHEVDVVALPLKSMPLAVKIYPFDLALADVDIVIDVGLPVSIIGFPFGLASGGAFPIWKTGHVASDHDLDYDGKPAFLIDATTRGGMSGSPVVHRRFGSFRDSSGAQHIAGGNRVRFLGVYSGRIHGEAESGRVWRPHIIREIIASGGA